MDLIDKKSIRRASRAIKCLSFNSTFFKEAKENGLSAEKVFEMKTKFLIDGKPFFKSSNEIESEFIWLITVGILRREVDGQGLTSKVRLTPLGRQIIENEPELINSYTGFFEKLSNWFYRKIIFK
tara:strand:+ start:325 stop:699 length:375 start_codon:yes stop_codon:yes gene_type:complete